MQLENHSQSIAKPTTSIFFCATLPAIVFQRHPLGALKSKSAARVLDKFGTVYYGKKNSVLNTTHNEIAARAYEFYLARGKVSGHEVEDWFEAERQLSDERLGTRRSI
jgi:hypothetical protein